MNKTSLDEIDHEIIRRLSEDARLNNRIIADALGLTEGTIRARLKRLREARMIRFTALTNLAAVGSTRIVFFRVRTEIARLRDVGQAMAAIPQIKCVIITTGAYGILAMAPVADLEHEAAALTAQINALPGVSGVQCSVTIQAVKYNNRIAKILSQPEPAEDEDSDRE